MENFKVIISYNGGSGGDMFVKSSNGEFLTELQSQIVKQPATLKNYENKVRLCEPADLNSELNALSYKFVNTHLLEEVVNKGHEVYNVVISDPDTQLKTIYRQMQLQRLRLFIDTRYGSWYTTISKLCNENNYAEAAKFWFEKAKEIWLDRMEYRLKYTEAKLLDFSKLYDDSFVDDLSKQGWNYSINVLKYNHQRWLDNNKVFTYEKTINTMSNKLSKMDWKQESGWIQSPLSS